jgi:glutamyl-tRNA reductase
MLGYYKIITTNHNINSTNTIGDYAVETDHKEQAFKSLSSLDISELLYLATCNRVLYLFYCPREIDKTFISSFFATIKKTDFVIEDWLSKLEVYEGEEAVGHIMEVAGSIDSLVVGEREIFRQYRSAFKEAKEKNLIGDNLRILDKAIVQTSKSIYTNTRIGEKPLSIASLAMTSMLELLPYPNHIVFIGAGETNTLLGKLLLNNYSGKYSVFNRTKKNADRLAKLVNGASFSLDSLRGIADFDILIISTASRNIIWSNELMEMIHEKYGNRKRILVDLSVPSNIERSITHHTNVILITIDNLNKLAEVNLEARKNEIVLAKEIVTKSRKGFRKMYNERKLELALSSIPQEVNKVKEKAITEVFSKKLDKENEETRKLIEEMMSYMAKKCISIPIKTAKQRLL